MEPEFFVEASGICKFVITMHKNGKEYIHTSNGFILRKDFNGTQTITKYSNKKQAIIAAKWQKEKEKLSELARDERQAKVFKHKKENPPIKI